MADETKQDILDMLGSIEDSELDVDVDQDSQDVDQLDVGEATNDTDVDDQTSVEPASEPDPAANELSELRQQLRQAQQTIADLAKGKQTGVEPDPQPDDGLGGFQLQDIPWKDEMFVDEDFDFTDLNATVLNQMLNRAASVGAQTGAKTAAKQVLLSIPGIVKHNIRVESSAAEAVKRFYKENKDLTGFKQAVATVAQELGANNPDWSLDKLFNEAGKETRKRLNLANVTQQPANTSRRVGPSPKGQNRRPGNTLSKFEQDVEAMLRVR